jgi:hypothetical protein
MSMSVVVGFLQSLAFDTNILFLNSFFGSCNLSVPVQTLKCLGTKLALQHESDINPDGSNDGKTAHRHVTADLSAGGKHFSCRIAG